MLRVCVCVCESERERENVFETVFQSTTTEVLYD